MCYTEKLTISSECTLQLLWLATVDVFTGILYIWKYREKKKRTNLFLRRNRITRISPPFKNFTFCDRSCSIKREAGCRIVGNRYDEDKRVVEDARWKSGWQIKSCEGGWVCGWDVCSERDHTLSCSNVLTISVPTSCLSTATLQFLSSVDFIRR